MARGREDLPLPSWSSHLVGEISFLICMRSFKQADSRKADGGNSGTGKRLWVSLWSWTGIPSHTPASGPQMGCLGVGSGYRSESWAYPSPGTRPVGESKLNLHTRVHCGCSACPGLCQPFRLPENTSRLAAPGATSPWPRRRPHTQASLAQWGSWTTAA